jgi:fluoride exporter
MSVESYVWIALGSALGGAARLWCARLAARRLGVAFPWGTLLVNVSGSLIIGLADAVAGAGAPAREFVMAGLCGGYTTFSAFSLQTLALAHDGRPLRAGVNVCASVAACLAAVWLGHVAGLAFLHMLQS